MILFALKGNAPQSDQRCQACESLPRFCISSLMTGHAAPSTPPLLSSFQKVFFFQISNSPFLPVDLQESVQVGLDHFEVVLGFQGMAKCIKSGSQQSMAFLVHDSTAEAGQFHVHGSGRE